MKKGFKTLHSIFEIIDDASILGYFLYSSIQYVKYNYIFYVISGIAFLQLATLQRCQRLTTMLWQNQREHR